jgi:hypothetical protein
MAWYKAQRSVACLRWMVLSRYPVVRGTVCRG